MLIDLYNTAEFIKVNKLKEVDDPILFAKGSVPSPRGLISTDIFGVSMKERQETYAYIDLVDNFLNPFIYKLLKRMDRKFESIVHANKRFIIKDGLLIEDEENGETGLKFLYKNWEKINFEKNNSTMRNERIDVLKAYKKDVLFTRYWIVIPPFYRDVNFQSVERGIVSHRVINDKYSKLIRLTSVIKSGNGFDFVLDGTRAKIQNQLVDIYDFLKGQLEKKQGMIRKNLLGKSIDYGARSVISAPTFHANKPSEMTIDFYHTGVPLAQCCSLFTPFIIAWVNNYFKQEFSKSGNKYPVKNKNGEIEFVELDNPESYFDNDMIKKEVDNFIYAYADRFKPIELPVKGSKNKVYFTFIAREYSKNKPESESNIIERPATWADILYQAAVDVTKDKHVYITRYPMTDYFGTFPNKISVMSTHKTMPVYINDRVYPNYPYIDLDAPKDKVAISFVDTISMSNLYLAGLGGDYDGDQISIKGLFSQEANAEADKQLRSKSHILNIYGDNMRKTTNEGIQTLYMMTKFEDSK